MKSRKLEAGFEQEMLGATSPAAEQRDLDRNFGGDPSKKSICVAVDAGRKPSTACWVEAAPAQWERYQGNRGTEREVKWDGVRISVGQRVFAGTLKTNGMKNNLPFVLIDSDELLDSLIDDVLAYRASRPMGRRDALETLTDLDSTIEHLAEHNRQVNFAPFKARRDAARKEYGQATLSGDVSVDKLDFRTFVEEVVEIGRDVVAAVEDAINQRNQRMADSIGADITARTAAALSMKSSKDRRNALVAIGTDLFGAGGRDPQHPSQQRDTVRQGIGNRPDRGYGRSGNPGARKSRHMGNRF